MKNNNNSPFLIRMIAFILLFSTFLMVVDFYSIGFFDKIGQNIRALFIAPVHRYISDINENISYVWRDLKKSRERELELSQLRAKLEEKMLDRLLLDQINAELKEIRKHLAVADHLDFESSMARIIAHDPESHYMSIVINKGFEHGFTEGMPVVGYQGKQFALVGFLSKVSTKSSLVQTLLHQRTEASVYIADSETLGIVKGQTLASPFIILDYIDRKTTELNGQFIKTSGIGGKYPAGLLVGSIAYAVEKDYKVFRTAYVRPHIDFFSLKSVYIITKKYQIDKIDKAGQESL